jgi:hypothetical protein
VIINVALCGQKLRQPRFIRSKHDPGSLELPLAAPDPGRIRAGLMLNADRADFDRHAVIFEDHAVVIVSLWVERRPTAAQQAVRAMQASDGGPL